MDTLLLDRARWDLVADAQGNIARATRPYAISQDVASACRLFRRELWYDTAKGIPYFEQVLGKRPPLGLIKSLLTTAALTVPDVATAKAFVSEIVGREVRGQVQTTDTAGQTMVVTSSFPPAFNPLTDEFAQVLTDEAGVPLA